MPLSELPALKALMARPSSPGPAAGHTQSGRPKRAVVNLPCCPKCVLADQVEAEGRSGYVRPVVHVQTLRGDVFRQPSNLMRCSPSPPERVEGLGFYGNVRDGQSDASQPGQTTRRFRQQNNRRRSDRELAQPLQRACRDAQPRQVTRIILSIIPFLRPTVGRFSTSRDLATRLATRVRHGSATATSFPSSPRSEHLTVGQ